MVRNNRKKNKAAPRNDSESKWEQWPENGEEHTAKSPSVQEQHLHNIMSYWKLGNIIDTLSSDFVNFNNEDFEPSTLHLLFEIAKRRPGIDGRERARLMITTCWDSRSQYSQDRPNGHDNPRAKQAYLREDLEAILDQLEKVETVERAGKAVADLHGTEDTAKTPTSNPNAAPVHTRKRANEDTDAEANAKRQKSTSPARNVDDTEQQDDITIYYKNQLLELINTQWGMSADHVVPDEIKAKFPLAKKKSLAWNEEALRGLCKIMNMTKGRSEAPEPNELRIVLEKAYDARIKRPGETREFIKRDTENVMNWMNGRKFAFDPPGVGLHGVTNVQVFQTAIPAPPNGMANNATTTGANSQASSTSGNAAPASQEGCISISSDESEEGDAIETDPASSSHDGNASQAPDGGDGQGEALDAHRESPTRPETNLSSATRGDDGQAAQHPTTATHGDDHSSATGRREESVAQTAPQPQGGAARSSATGQREGIDQPNLQPDRRVEAQYSANGRGAGAAAQNARPPRRGAAQSSAAGQHERDGIPDEPPLAQLEYQRVQIEEAITATEIERELNELRADVVAAQRDHDELPTPQSVAQLKIAKLRLAGKEAEAKAMELRGKLMELNLKIDKKRKSKK